MESVKVYLLDRNNEVQYGLNWGQRDGREPNQAYLQLTPEVYRSDFFPVKKHYFLVETDDDISFVMNRGQKGEDGSALETPEDNSLLGKYLRKRLGVPEGQKIEKHAIDSYGRSDIEFVKIATNHYKLDFSAKTINTEVLFREFLKTESKSEGTIRQYISDLKKYSEGCFIEKAISKKIFAIIDSFEYAEERKKIENSNYYREHALARQTEHPTSGLNITAALNHYETFIQSDFFKKNYEKDSFKIPFSPTQTIFYGVPGSGKSHKIDEETKDLPDEQKMRVVFHPEYTNADFVGQILPSNADGTISYKFKPGPFTKILRRAYLNPSKEYCLIIEEINRGNAAAIFGDVFQLLDRITDGKGEASGGYSYGNGWSRYSIENEFMNWYIRENLYADTNHKLQNEDDGIARKSADESQKAIEIGELHFSALTGIRLPPNLSLYATMNTSDQNVFTLDNAFQRRWDMKLVENKFEGDDAEKQRNAKIGGTDVSWGIFQTHINKKIGEISSSVGMSSMEDKRLGCWFVKADSNENGSAISKEKFAEKVLKYLWDDAFKFNREEIFDLKDKTQSQRYLRTFSLRLEHFQGHKLCSELHRTSNVTF